MADGKAPTVIDGSTGEVLGADQTFNAQDAKRKFVEAVVATNTQNQALNAIASELKTDRDETSVATGQADRDFVNNLSQPKTEVKPKKGFFDWLAGK